MQFGLKELLQMQWWQQVNIFMINKLLAYSSAQQVK